MPSPLELHLETQPALAETAGRLFYAACHAPSAAAYFQTALAAVKQTAGADFVAIVRGEKGIWRTIAASSAERQLPAELLAEALDADALTRRGDWVAVPI